MNKIDLIIDALSVAQNSVWSALNQEALAYAVELKTELAKLEQEPVAWMMPDYGDVLSASEADGTGIYNIPLYTAPPKPEQKSISTNDHLCAMLRQVHDVLACTALPMKRPWVGLTDEEINDFDKKLRDNGDYCSLHFAWGISAKLKEKNNAVCTAPN